VGEQGAVVRGDSVCAGSGAYEKTQCLHNEVLLWSFFTESIVEISGCMPLPRKKTRQGGRKSGKETEPLTDIETVLDEPLLMQVCA